MSRRVGVRVDASIGRLAREMRAQFRLEEVLVASVSRRGGLMVVCPVS